MHSQKKEACCISRGNLELKMDESELVELDRWALGSRVMLCLWAMPVFDAERCHVLSQRQSIDEIL